MALTSKLADPSLVYKKVTQLEHVLLRADMYVGSKDPETGCLYVPVETDSTTKMVQQTVIYIPAFLKIFDEILVNAADNAVRDSECNTIKVSIDEDRGQISVWNNGSGIPVAIHEKEKIYVPEMIFGHLLTSSNFNDDEKKITGGRNGYGAKLTNIFSTEFSLETFDSKSGSLYKQKWTNNMSACTPAKITKPKKPPADYTKITFIPDFAKFGMQGIDSDHFLLLKKRVYDLTGSLSKVKVFLNNARIKVSSFKDYVSMYLGNTGQLDETESVESSSTSAPVIVFDKPNDRWSIALSLSETGQFGQVSFVNSIATMKGGTHVNHVLDQIVGNIVKLIEKKDKNLSVKPAQIKNSLFLFVNCFIENPSYSSQTKEYMTLPLSKFGSTCDISDAFMKKVAKLGIVEKTIEMLHQKDLQKLKKTDGTKRSRVTGILKLSDANEAGTKKSAQCTLFLCEGESAKSFAITGIPQIKNGHDFYGVYPLKGKLLNVRDASTKQRLENKEITELKQILGLQDGKVYKDVSSLRYGHVCCLVDADLDGHHIKGLILNWLESSFPSLLKIPGFVLDFCSPIVKCTKGKESLVFYFLRDYEQWKEKNNGGEGWTLKYFKGLGTSTPADTKKYFSNISNHLKRFREIDEKDCEDLDMVFSKRRVTDRKNWLKNFTAHGTTVSTAPQKGSDIRISDFINRDFIEFSMYDNVRSIPSAIDGLKPGQRKVLYTCFKTRLNSDIKVAQLAAEVSKRTEYRHGEVSLCETIVGMAQDFVGSNNLPVLSPEGAFGTRLRGGKDAGASRYIYTKLCKETRKVFRADDDPILEYLYEDGQEIEPKYYVPIIPMVLINGAEGIGSGYSTKILSYNPKTIIDSILKRLEHDSSSEMTDGTFQWQELSPWYKGFEGTITLVEDTPEDGKAGKKKYLSKGRLSVDKTSITITELPIGTWTMTYKEYLEDLLSDKIIQDYKEYNTDTKVKFVVKLPLESLEKLSNGKYPSAEENLLHNLKLVSILHASNMMLFDRNGKLQKYSSTADIMEEFYSVRIDYYNKRKAFLLDDLQRQRIIAENKYRFIKEIIESELIISKRKKTDIEKDLFSRKYHASEDGHSGPFNYLLNMSLGTLTEEKLAELEKQVQELKTRWEYVHIKTVYEMYKEELQDLVL